MTYTLDGKCVQLVSGQARWRYGLTTSTFVLVDATPHVADAYRNIIALIWSSCHEFYVVPRNEEKMAKSSTLRDMELAVYDRLVEQGELDPMVALLL